MNKYRAIIDKLNAACAALEAAEALIPVNKAIPALALLDVTKAEFTIAKLAQELIAIVEADDDDE